MEQRASKNQFSNYTEKNQTFKRKEPALAHSFPNYSVNFIHHSDTKKSLCIASFDEKKESTKLMATLKSLSTLCAPIFRCEMGNFNFMAIHVNIDDSDQDLGDNANVNRSNLRNFV